MTEIVSQPTTLEELEAAVDELGQDPEPTQVADLIESSPYVHGVESWEREVNGTGGRYLVVMNNEWAVFTRSDDGWWRREEPSGDDISDAIL